MKYLTIPPIQLRLVVMKKNNNFSHLMRKWHRDLGYFVVTISLVYGLSGIFLTHKEVFPGIETIENKTIFPSEMKISDFSAQWDDYMPHSEINKCFESKNSTIKFYFNGGRGTYKIKNGEVVYENYKEHHFTNFVNHLHNNQIKGWKYIADFFALGLIFLALSGLVMVKGNNSFRKRGIWFMLSGMLTVIAFLFI